jgi:disulfide bond formation protein DsbB
MQGSSMTGMTGMMMPGAQGMTSIASASPYENPWYLLGWALLALVSLIIIGGVVLTIVWIARRTRSTQQA